MARKGKKLTLNSVVLGNIRRRGRQNAVLVLGVALAVFFLSAVVFGSSCLVASMRAQSVRNFGRANIFMWNADDTLRQEIAAAEIFSETGEMELIYASEELGREYDTHYTVGRYNEQIDYIQQYQLLEGRFPEKQGEIAIEMGRLLLMRTDTQIGSEVTLSLYCFDGETAMPEPIEKTFTLVGILDKKGDPYNGQWHTIWELNDESMFRSAPEVLVSEQEPLQPGTREMRMLMGIYADSSGPKRLYEIVDAYEKRVGRYFFYTSVYSDLNYFGDLFASDSQDLASLVGVLAVFVSLAAACMAGIANALTSNIDKRKGQIGMLRAIGATRTQIRKLLLRETLTMMVFTLPLGIVCALGALKIIQAHSGGWMVWSVPVWMLLLDVFACALCIWIASNMPVRRSARITPMQAVRDIDLTRNFLWKGEKSRRKFVPQRLIARRSSMLRRGRSIGMTVLLAAGAVLFSVSVMFAAECFYNVSDPEDSDIYIGGSTSFRSNHPWEYGDYINENLHGNRFTYADLADVEALPYIERIETVTEQRVNILLDEITDYITIGHYSSMAHYAFNEIYSHDRMVAASQGIDPAEYEGLSLRREIEASHADYLDAKEHFGIEGEFLSTSILGLSREKIERLHEYVIEGVIDVEKVLSGEEVLVLAPEEVALAFRADDGGSSSYTLYNGESNRDLDLYIGMGHDLDDYIRTESYKNDLFHAGDMLKFEIWQSESECSYDENDIRTWPDDVQRNRRTVKIGAILNEDAFEYFYGNGHVSVITGRDVLGDVGISEVDIWLEEGLDEELQQQISAQIESIAARSGRYFYDSIAQTRSNRQVERVFILVCVVICCLFFAFTWAMLNNAVAGRIRGDIRQIGTMRAVGASKRIVFRAYVWQFYRIFLVGGLIAWVISAVLNFYLFGMYRTWSYYLAYQLPLVLVTPLYCVPMLLLCMLGVYAKLRPIFRESVVSNIRML